MFKKNKQKENLKLNRLDVEIEQWCNMHPHRECSTVRECSMHRRKEALECSKQKQVAHRPSLLLCASIVLQTSSPHNESGGGGLLFFFYAMLQHSARVLKGFARFHSPHLDWTVSANATSSLRVFLQVNEETVERLVVQYPHIVFSTVMQDCKRTLERAYQMGWSPNTSNTS